MSDLDEFIKSEKRKDRKLLWIAAGLLLVCIAIAIYAFNQIFILLHAQ